MKLLTSKKGIELPILYLISNREELKEIPIGVPFFFGDDSVEDYLVRLLEYEVLYQNCIRTGYPFNFKKLLLDNGYNDLYSFNWHETIYMDYVTEGLIEDEDEEGLKEFSKERSQELKDYIKDNTCYVDLEKIKSLNVFPIWLDKIEKAISTNIHNFSIFNPNMYNKKLEGMYGALELTAPPRNLLIIDISGSIPKAVSATTLILAKNLAETFFADMLITGSKSTLYEYERIYELNIDTIYSENGMDNDQAVFKKLVSSEKRIYKTCIAFGDNHHPGQQWSNDYNKKTTRISDKNGKKLCKWEIENLISFHVTSKEEIAGYSRWFEPTNIEKIEDWVTYLDK